MASIENTLERILSEMEGQTRQIVSEMEQQNRQIYDAQGIRIGINYGVWLLVLIEVGKIIYALFSK